MFGNPPAYGVIVKPGCLCGFVFGARASGGGDCCEAVFCIPLKALRCVFPAEFLDQAAVADSKLLRSIM